VSGAKQFRELAEINAAQDFRKLARVLPM